MSDAREDRTTVVGLIGDCIDYVTHCATADMAARDARYHRARRGRFTSVRTVNPRGETWRELWARHDAAMRHSREMSWGR